MFLTFRDGYETFSVDNIYSQDVPPIIIGAKCVSLLNDYSEIIKYTDFLLENFHSFSFKEDTLGICAKNTELSYYLKLDDIWGIDFFKYLIFFSIKHKYLEINKLRDEFEDTIKLIKSYNGNPGDLEKKILEFDDKYYIDMIINYTRNIKDNIETFYNSINEKMISEWKYFEVHTIPKKTIRYFYKNPKLTYVSHENVSDKDNIIQSETYEIFEISDIIQIYQSLIIDNRIIIKKCSNCHRFFIPTSRTDEKYCNNISPQSKTKTCKEYGAKATYRSSIQNSILKKEHERTSQYYRMKIMREKDNKVKNKYIKIFELYKENYNKKKEQYKNKKITEEEFKEWIISQKMTIKEGNKNEYKRKSKE